MKYLISGIGPGVSGVGRLMCSLKPRFELDGFKVIYRRESKSIRRFRERKQYYLAIRELILREVDHLWFYIKVRFIKNSDLICIHPQTIGFNLLFILQRSNKVSLYVMDNSFFCIRSYNVHPIKNTECLKCIGSINPDPLCSPFPVKISFSRNVEFLKKLQKLSDGFTFLVQNHLQGRLIKEHFGIKPKVSIIGMDTNELVNTDVKYQKEARTYDVVFHGHPIISKGLLYVVQLADEIPELVFFIPGAKKSIESTLGRDLPANIICELITWETGLKQVVANAKLVINPSVWSAPIEGALVKSAAFNANVATVRTEYGFEGEITTIKNHLRLSRDVKIGARELRVFISELY
jgi:hypothetical protein